MKPLEAGTVIQSRYLIRELIGKGGMGQVYLAVDQRLGNSVALKRTTVGDDRALADAFENEAKTLAQLRHPFLPKVSDHFVDGDEQFLVMEYIGGDDLAKRLKSLGKPFPLNWVLFWADELLEALHYLHTHDPPILHRDIKPQNLKLTGDNHIVLLDFGLSKNTMGETRITTSGSVVGYTPHYAPMEQIRATGTSALSDIYSLSATLYHLLSNWIPPDALTRADAIIAGNPDPIRPLMELNGEVTEVISEAIMKGMELNQEKRFPAARDMQKTLRRAYNELQKSMSADTVAFNVNEINDGDGFSGDKTEVMSGPLPAELMSEPASEPVSEPVADADKTEVIDAAQMREIAGSQVSEPTVSEKTEVMRDLPQFEPEPVTPDVHVSEAPAAFDTSDDIGGLGDEFEDFKTSEDIDPSEFKTSEDIDTGGHDATLSPGREAEGAAADATIPFIALDPNKVPSTEESGEEETGEEEPWESHPAAADFGMTEQISASHDEGISETPASEPPRSVPTEVPDDGGGSSTGKYVIILLGLGAVLILLFGSVLGIGYYYYRGGLGGGNETPVPTPVTTPSAVPSATETPFQTPEETPEATLEASPEETPSPEQTREPGRTPTPRRTPSRTPARTPTRTPPPRTPTPRPTVKKTPKVLPTILQ